MSECRGRQVPGIVSIRLSIPADTDRWAMPPKIGMAADARALISLAVSGYHRWNGRGRRVGTAGRSGFSQPLRQSFSPASSILLLLFSSHQRR